MLPHLQMQEHAVISRSGSTVGALFNVVHWEAGRLVSVRNSWASYSYLVVGYQYTIAEMMHFLNRQSFLIPLSRCDIEIMYCFWGVFHDVIFYNLLAAWRTAYIRLLQSSYSTQRHQRVQVQNKFMPLSRYYSLAMQANKLVQTGLKS